MDDEDDKAVGDGAGVWREMEREKGYWIEGGDDEHRIEGVDDEEDTAGGDGGDGCARSVCVCVCVCVCWGR